MQSANADSGETGKQRSRTVYVGAAVLVLAIGGYLARDLFFARGEEICGDGRRRIDAREFVTQYSQYSLSLEGELAGRGKGALKLEPRQMQVLSEAVQQGNEFRKALVAGYNSCAVPKESFEKSVKRFAAADQVALQIRNLASKAELTAEDHARLDALTGQYLQAVRELAQP